MVDDETQIDDDTDIDKQMMAQRDKDDDAQIDRYMMTQHPYCLLPMIPTKDLSRQQYQELACG